MADDLNRWQRLKEDIYCVFERDPAARNVFEVITTYPGVHALLMHRFSHWLWTHDLKWFARFFSTFNPGQRVLKFILLHELVVVFSLIMVWGW
jgi:serine acetyltransferase